MTKSKKIIGYTTGVYDMFHIGHLNVLRNARQQCDYLIVGVSTDELVAQDKYKIPVIPFDERCQIVKAIRYVDEVVPQADKNKLGAWHKYHFDRMFVGSDWQGTPQWADYERQFAPLGVEIVYLPHTGGISSTRLRCVLLQQSHPDDPTDTIPLAEDVAGVAGGGKSVMRTPSGPSSDSIISCKAAA